MTRQEEIREGFSDRVYGLAYQPPDIDAILQYLKSEGMVLKVDTKLPPIDNSKGEWKTGLEYKQDIEKMNLTAYEELM